MDRQRAEHVRTLRNGTVTTKTFIPFFAYLFVRFVLFFYFHFGFRRVCVNSGNDRKTSEGREESKVEETPRS